MESNVIQATIKGMDLQFQTHPALFSPQRVDAGTLLMLSQVTFQPEDKVLDLGCGYGVVGITAGKAIGPDRVVMSDISEAAVETSRHNILRNKVHGILVRQSDGFRNITEKEFTLILSNPPYHTDFSVAKHFIETGYRKLCLGGRLYMVTKRKEWYKRKFISVFGGVRITEDQGYYVFCGEKRFRPS